MHLIPLMKLHILLFAEHQPCMEKSNMELMLLCSFECCMARPAFIQMKQGRQDWAERSKMSWALAWCNFPVPGQCTPESLLWVGRVPGPLSWCCLLNKVAWGPEEKQALSPQEWRLLPSLNTLLRDAQESLGTVLCVISLLSRGDSNAVTVNAQRYWGSGITSVFPSLCWRKVPSPRIK